MRHYTREAKAYIPKPKFPDKMSFMTRGGAVQVDPGFLQLTPRLLSALETKL